MKYVAKKMVKHACTNCAKVGFGKKIISMVNAVVHGTRPRKYECRFMAPGLTNYPGEKGKPEKWLISRETMNSMQNSFIGCPVVAESKHEAGTVPDDFDTRVKKGDYDGVITGVRTNADDGWDYAEFIVWDPEVQEQIEKDGYNVSCAFNTVESLPGGVYNAIDYDAEVARGEYIHMAIVSAPRQTGARIFLNSIVNQIDNREAGAILFNMSGILYKLFARGRIKANAMDADAISKFIDEALAAKKPLKEITEELIKMGLTDDQIQDAIGEVIKKTMHNVAPEGWEETIQGMKKHAEIENPWALAWWMKGKGMKGNEDLLNSWNDFKKNEGGNKMFKCTKCNKEHETEEQMKACGCKTNALEIDPATAVIATPEGDVPLKDMINAYQAAELAKKNSKKIMGKNSAGADTEYDNQEEYEEYKKLTPEAQKMYDEAIEAGKSHAEALEAAASKQGPKVNDKNIGLDDEFEGVKVSDMYNAYKATKKNEETPEEKKAREEKEALRSKVNADFGSVEWQNEKVAEIKRKAEAGEKLTSEEEVFIEVQKEHNDRIAAETKKNADDTRRAALKEEGKTDEEIETIMKSEAEAAEKAAREKPEDKEKQALAEKAEQEKEKVRVNHFNSLKDARRLYEPKIDPDKKRITRSESIKIAKDSKQY